MKYIDEYRDAAMAQHIAKCIALEADPNRQYKLMEFCGGHTHAISRYGVLELLPPHVQMIHGPGCPVCVLPIGRLDMAIALALEHRVTLCTYADTLRVPASKHLSLLKAKALGADIRMVYSPSDALKLALENPDLQVVFFAIGFETTTPPTAWVISQAQKAQLKNFSVMCNHVLTPPAIQAILDGAAAGNTAQIDGFIGPAHVSIVIGSDPYARFAAAHQKPMVIAGFEPLDVLQAIRMLVAQINQGRAEIENEFIRAVTPLGNQNAQKRMAQVFEVRASFEWRGLGAIPHSALQIAEAYRDFDAEHRFALAYQTVADNKACECGAILRGIKKPSECKIFGTVCTPENPIGSCMVSSEGACAAHYTYGRFRQATEKAELRTGRHD